MPIIFVYGAADANPVAIEMFETEEASMNPDNYVLEIGIGRLIMTFVNLFTDGLFL